MLYIYHGEDEFSLREELAALKAELDADGMLASNTSVLDGRQLQLGDFLAPCSHRSLPRQPPARRSRGTAGALRGAALTGAQPPRKGIARGRGALEEPASGTAGPARDHYAGAHGRKAGRRKPLAPTPCAFRHCARVSAPAPAEVPEWISARARTAGLSISPGAVDLLADLIGNDLRLLVQELQKLTTYARDRQVKEDDVRALVSGAREASVFNMVDAVVEGRGGLAVRLVQQLQNEGASPTYLLTMITRQYRHLILAKELLLARLSVAEIGQRLGISSDFALRKVLEQATRYPLPRLEAAYHFLLEADAAIKRGTYGEELALDILLADLTKKPSVAPTRSRAPATPTREATPPTAVAEVFR